MQPTSTPGTVADQIEAAGLRGRSRRLTSKALVAEQVAEAAPLAASLPAAGPTAQHALPGQAPLQGASSALHGTTSALQDSTPALQGTAGKGLRKAEGTADLPPSADKGSLKQKAEDKAAEGKAQLEDVAKLANELQPTGSTLSTMQVHTKVCKRFHDASKC